MSGMRTLLIGGILLGLAWQTNVASAETPCDSPDNETRVHGEKEPKLLVFIHGDVSSGGAADYIYERARESLADGRVVVALLRPGYLDSSGNQSSGDNFDRQAAVLAACPCYIAEWRNGRRRWAHSLSPDEVIKRVPVTTSVVALTGAADDNTRPVLAQDYVKALAKRGVPARFVLVTGAGHNEVFRGPELRSAIDEVIAQLGR